MVNSAPVGFRKAQKRLLWLCILAYTVSYLCRTNLSLALSDFISLLHISNSAAGLWGTVYFWTYAAGQLVSGPLGARFGPKPIIAVGLFASGLCNFLLGFTGSYWGVLVLWLLNGAALALLWAPLVQIASNWFPPEEYGRISVLLNLPTTVGYLLVWGVLGGLKSVLPWRSVFFLPAAASILFGFLWLCRARPAPKNAGFEVAFSYPSIETEPKNKSLTEGSVWKAIFTVTMLTFAFIVLTQGSTRESINLWAPTMLHDIGRTLSGSVISASLMTIPLFSTAGLLLTGWIIRRFRDGSNVALLILLGSGTVFSLLLLVFHGSFGFALTAMGLLMATLYGSTVIVTTLIPLSFARYGKSAQLCGFFNFLAYLGAALGGFLSGAVSDRYGWNAVYILWAVLNVTGLLLLLLSRLGNYRSVRGTPKNQLSV